MDQHPPAGARAPQISSLATFRVTTREVLVDLIALRGRDEPVLDLKPEDLQISEISTSPEQDSSETHTPKATKTTE
ncbi:MAG TPA: hypothetical protein VGR64_07735, partial [Terracidiphilus sp.]|nr:hypothetical protein [Terracidiphilus sp.]